VLAHPLNDQFYCDRMPELSNMTLPALAA